jgi:hypothetical protein
MKLTLLRIRRAASFILPAAIFLTAAPGLLPAQYKCIRSDAFNGVVNTGLAANDPVQNGRVARDSRPSSCTGKTNVLQNSDPVNYKAQTFANPTGQAACVTVTLEALGCQGAQVGIVAYSTFDPANPAANVIGDLGVSTSGSGTFAFPVAAGASFTIVVHDLLLETPNALCPNFAYLVRYHTSCRQAGFDRTNDGRADVTVWRPSNGFWYSVNSAGGFNFFQFGAAGDIIAAGDYTNDNQTDYGVYRPNGNNWFYTTTGANFVGFQFGAAGDVPVPGDYDRDGKQDAAIWRPSDGVWYVLRSENNTLRAVQWGRSGDTPVWGDYDGDLAADFAVVRTGEAPGDANQYRWYVLLSGSSFVVPPSFLAVSWGLTGDKPVPGDYDGDAKSDIAVFRPSDGVWYYLKSADGQFAAFQWGTNGDIPQPADYDGDRIMDFAVFRPSADPNANFWYIRNSSNGAFSSIEWGEPNDQPASAPYRVQ